MPEFTTHPAGTFCYAELASPDPAASGEFYTNLFGWGRNDQDMGEYGVYTQFTLGGRVVAAQYRIQPDQLAQGAPPHWSQYVAVDDVDASSRRAVELGADVLTGPLDVNDLGRMSVLRDPQGAFVNLWQAGANCGVGVLDEPGAMCWNELMSRDRSGAVDFYTALFGWGTDGFDMGDQAAYTVWSRAEGRPAGGMIPITPTMGQIPDNWLLYFQVKDPDRTSARAAELGGQVAVAPADIPNAGRFAVVIDPVGAVFGIYLSRR